MSPDAAYEEGVGRILPQGGPQADFTANAEGLVWRLVLPTSRGCNVRSGLAVGGYLRIRPPEYSIAIYFDQNYYGPVSGVKAEPRAKGDNAVGVTFIDS